MRLPGAEDRTVVIGPTGSGKTVGAAWILSKQRFDKRPWVAIDFKEEILWDELGSPPMRKLKLGDMPGKLGLYRMEVMPGQEDELNDWFWKVWKRGDIGLFADEVSLFPKHIPRNGFRAILRQGRSKHIPVIACTQRPVDCDREVFTESQYRMLYGIEDMARDYPVIKGLFGRADVREPLPPHHFYWYDAKLREVERLRPVPKPASVIVSLRDVVPRQWSLAG